MKLFSLLCSRPTLRIAVIAMVVMIVGATMVKLIDVTSASPETHLFVDPPQVSDVQPGDTFLVRINVSEALPTYSWEFFLSWDRTLLNVTSIEEGDFLHRWTENPFPPPDYLPAYETSFAPPPLDEANAKGEMGPVLCTLIGEVPWASGNGWLATLNFTVKSTGSTLLNLFGTLLWDQVVGGYPAPNLHPNDDGFFSNLSPPIHDIRISKVTPLPVNVIRGSIVNMNVTVLNEGTETEPSVILNVKANDTIIGTTTRPLNGTGNSENRTYTLTVDWDTAGLAFGMYNVTASVPAVTGEVDTADNFVVVRIVKVLLHDIAVTDVIANATSVKIGEVVSVNATVANVGSETEFFDVAAYYDNSLIKSQSINNFASGSQANVTFTWNTTFVSPGIYTIKANATLATDTNTTNSESIDGEVTVSRPAGYPVADFTYSPLKPVTNQTITFTSTSYDTDGYIASWAWDFNDDGTIDATTEVATWNYTASDDYTVRLTVHDNDSLTPSIGIEKTITVYPRLVVIFTHSPQNPLINEAVTFDASASYDPDGTLVGYSWDFGDDQTGNGKIVSHTFTSFGTYIVRLNVTDNDGLTGAKSSEVRVAKAPTASFTFAPSSPLAFETITFDASSSTPNGGSIIKYFWDFGDDNIADEADPITTHAYTPADTYTVTLTVTDSEDLTSTFTQSIEVGKQSSTTLIEVPSSITKGEKVTITGSISPERKGVTVTILYRLSGAENWTLLDTVTTNDNSQYSYDWTPTAAGTYEVKTRWEGDASTVGDESDIKTITVQETTIFPTDLMVYLIVGVVVVIAAAVAVYFLKFRKQKT